MDASGKKGLKIHSINNLELYGPYMCLYSILVFIAWNVFWYNFQAPNLCTEEKICPLYPSAGESYSSHKFWSKVAASSFGASFIVQLHQVLTSDRPAALKVPLYCAACCNIIACLSHTALAYDFLPVLMSAFGRVSHVARFGEWVSLVPLLVVMIHSLDIRDAHDTRMLFVSAGMQQISVLAGAVASVVPDLSLAIVFLTISIVPYCLIFYDMYRASVRMSAFLVMNISESGAVDKRLNKEGIIKSFYLTLSCSFCWTFVVIVYLLGVGKVISHEMEFNLQSIADVFIKLVYVHTLSLSQISVMNEEKLLNTINDVGRFFGKMKYMSYRGG